MKLWISCNNQVKKCIIKIIICSSAIKKPKFVNLNNCWIQAVFISKKHYAMIFKLK